MNLLMTGMFLTMSVLKPRIEGADDPLRPEFWFVISMALLVGFIFAYPMNWWLVSNNMKHGMITVRDSGEDAMGGHEGMDMGHESHEHSMMAETPSTSRILKMSLFSIFCLFAGVLISIKVL